MYCGGIFQNERLLAALEMCFKKVWVFIFQFLYNKVIDFDKVTGSMVTPYCVEEL
jgi:uncharacterized protein involved in tellurium resistance